MIPNWEIACEEAFELLVESSAKTDRAEGLYENLDHAFDLLAAAGIEHEEPADRDFFSKPGLYDMVRVVIPATAPDGDELKCEYFHLPAPNERFGLMCGSTDQLDPTYCSSFLFLSLDQLEGKPDELLVECSEWR